MWHNNCFSNVTEGFLLRYDYWSLVVVSGKCGMKSFRIIWNICISVHMFTCDRCVTTPPRTPSAVTLTSVMITSIDPPPPRHHQPPPRPSPEVGSYRLMISLSLSLSLSSSVFKVRFFYCLFFGSFNTS